MSWTVFDGWRGWTHTRVTYLFHNGPVVVMDSARHSGGVVGAAMVWHLAGERRRDGNSLWLREGAQPVRVALPDEA